jgi:hypothetical protein
MAGNIDEFTNGLTPEEQAELDKDEMANPDNGTADDTATVTPPDKTNDEEEEGSDPDKKPKAGEEADDEKTPFHKHPRWIAQRKKEEALEAELQEARAWREKYEPVIESVAKGGGEETTELPPIPDWFITAYGEDEELWALHLENEERLETEREERIIARIKSEQEESTTREQQDLQWVDDQLISVRENLQEGEPDFEDNELLKIVTDFRPSDEEGNLDFRAAYNILQKMKSAGTAPAPKPKNGSIVDKKNLAAHVIPSSSEPDTEHVASNEEFANGNKPW